MLYFLSLLASFIAVYFCFRYYSLTAGLKRLSTELKMMEDSWGQAQTLKLSMPDKYLADFLISLNHYLAQVEQHVLYFQKRELRFQKQIENISHDLRTPLTVIVGYLKWMQANEQEQPVDEELVKNLAVLTNKAESMKSLVEQFYDYARLRSSDYQIHLKQVDLARVLKESLLGHYQLLEAAQLSVDIDIPDSAVYVSADENSLERIFNNLLQNAGRYADTFLNIRLSIQEQQVCISFRNNSQTLQEEDVPYLFEEFYMKDSSRHQVGTGLGLAVARQLAKVMNGSLNVIVLDKSEKGLLLHFELIFPIHPL